MCPQMSLGVWPGPPVSPAQSHNLLPSRAPCQHPGPHSDGSCLPWGLMPRPWDPFPSQERGAPQGLALGWESQRVLAGEGPRGLAAAVGSGWLDGAHQSEADLPPLAWAEGHGPLSCPRRGSGPPGRRRTAEPSGQYLGPGDTRALGGRSPLPPGPCAHLPGQACPFQTGSLPA